MAKKVVVLGAGVSGLTCAVSLLKAGYKNVTVIGQYIPGDKTIGYTSPWAGASILSFASATDMRLREIDTDSHKVFHHLANNVPESTVIHCPGIDIHDQPDVPPADSTWVRHLYRDYRDIPTSELPKGASFGYTFTTYTLSVPKYLDWLVSQVTQLGGRVLRCHPVKSLQQVMDTYDCDILINSTGSGAKYLEDVQDTNMYTLRGQTVLVRAPHVKRQYYREGPGYDTYIIPRGDGTVICGGTMDPNNHDLNADPAITKDILRRCYELHPEITHNRGPDAFDIVSVNVGFRPSRTGGIRLEKEARVSAKTGKTVAVIHNYGHSSHGYQSSWGSAARVVKLVNSEAQLAKL